MKIVYMPPKSCIPYEKNTKKHPPRQIEALMRAITEFGFDQPIVVDQNMVIIKGHGRRQAAINLKLKLVPVIIRQIEPNEARFLRVADNQSSVGKWDTSALQAEMQDIKGESYDLTLSGFDLDEIDSIFSTSNNMGTGDIDLGSLNTHHQCSKCDYKW